MPRLSPLARLHGSKRTGTIYIVADNEGEARAVAEEMYRMAGCKPPMTMNIEPTHLVMKALRAIY